MKKKFGGMNRGAGDEGLFILIGLCIVIFVFIIPSNKLGPVPGIFSALGDKSQWKLGSTRPAGPSLNSSFSSNITVGAGNAAYEIDPWSEYITIEAHGDNPIDVTGWLLKNSKDTKSYTLSGNTIRYPIDAVNIPRAATYISPSNTNTITDIVLRDGDRLIVSSGASGITSPYKIVNFRENICSGYLEALPEYKFVPELERHCPRMKDEAGYENLDRQCKDYVSTISSCHTPIFGGVDKNKESCSNCVDGKSNLSSACVSFLRDHATYAMCLNNHKNDPDFGLKTWRVFLGRSFQMWDKTDEVISLLDLQGNLVGYKSY